GQGDHARSGMGRYYCSTGSVPILRWRLGDVALEAHDYGERFTLGGVQVSLHVETAAQPAQCRGR
ncbi:hypothetical protein B8W90_13890, partial [Staphylococcus hominis]